MTCREKLAIEHPEKINPECIGGCECCPSTYGYISDDKSMCVTHPKFVNRCVECWNQEVEAETYSLEEVKVMCDITDEDLARVEDEVDSLEKREERFNEIVKNEEIAQAIITSQKIILDSDVETELEWCGDNVVGISLVKSIKDSGERRQFETGAVRDIQEGKGRCDLMPLWVVGSITKDAILMGIGRFKNTGEINILSDVINNFSCSCYDDIYTMLLDVAKHFEEGAKKYGENNWQKGIPTKHYIDSAVRHYLKYRRGDQDEPHDRAFVWNILCCMWTSINKPELDDYNKED